MFMLPITRAEDEDQSSTLLGRKFVPFASHSTVALSNGIEIGGHEIHVAHPPDATMNAFHPIVYAT